MKDVKYKDRFSDINKQENAATVFKKIMDIYEKLNDDPS